MKTGAKIWLGLLFAAHLLMLLSLFINEAGIIPIIQTLLQLAAISLMLFFKMQIGFYLLCLLAVIEIFLSLGLLSLGPVLFISVLIGYAFRLGITWLCLKSSWEEMK